MPVYRLGRGIEFPPAEEAEEGLIAVGGDLSPRRLVRAYESGIFPWYEAGQPILWHSPDPRFVLTPDHLHVPRSLRRALGHGRFRFTLDTAFSQVIEACARSPREGQRGTWITDDMRHAYIALHRLGLAHSAEAWEGEKLAGGLYGVSLGGAFFGESMFTRRPDASKAAFVRLVEQLDRWEIRLIDSQVHTDHLARFGAEEWPRRRYLAALRRALKSPTRKGNWRFDEAATTGSP